ncbi:MAG: dihydrolipoyl dehydrogenase [Anaerolineae bacterium]
MTAHQYDVVVIGGGPGGYVAAIRAAQLGLRTAVVERENVGGVCLNWGCIPTKALLRNAEVLSLFRQARDFGITVEGLSYDFGQAIKRSRRVAGRMVKGVKFLLRKNGVELVQGEGYLAARHTVAVQPEGQELKAQHVIVATGSRPKTLPGIEVDGQRVITSRQALEQADVPQSLIIMGAGAIGVEFASIYQSYGCQVTLVEMLPQVLPLEDAEIAKVLARSLTRQGIKVMTGTRVEGVETRESGVEVRVSSERGEDTLRSDRVLVAIGRDPNSENLGLEASGVAIERGFIQVNERMETSVPGIYAIGDVAGPPLLAHKAMAEGVVAAEAIAGRETYGVDYSSIPRCTYCHPQVASIGLTEAQARDQGYEVKVGRFPFRANGRALAGGDYEGLVKLVVDARYGEILGAHIVGPEATEVIHEIALAKSAELTPAEIAATIHAHPTLSEALSEAALAVEGRAIHI